MNNYTNLECEMCGEITGDVRILDAGTLCEECNTPCDMCNKRDCSCDDDYMQWRDK